MSQSICCVAVKPDCASSSMPSSQFLTFSGSPSRVLTQRLEASLIVISRDFGAGLLLGQGEAENIEKEGTNANAAVSLALKEEEHTNHNSDMTGGVENKCVLTMTRVLLSWNI